MGKQRNGFVTNSSSSSYIFDEEWTKDSIYKMIHEFAESLIDARDELDKRLKAHDTFSAVYNQIKEIESAIDKNGYEKNTFKLKHDLIAKLRSDKGFQAMVDYILEEHELTLTFEDFFDFFRTEREVDEVRKFTKFEHRADFEDHPVFLMNMIDLCEANADLRYDIVDIIMWYDGEARADGKEMPERTDFDIDISDMYWGDYEDKLRAIEIEDLFAEARRRLGRIIISSEDGYIPYILADKLKDAAVYGCNHMG